MLKLDVRYERSGGSDIRALGGYRNFKVRAERHDPGIPTPPSEKGLIDISTMHILERMCESQMSSLPCAVEMMKLVKPRQARVFTMAVVQLHKVSLSRP